MQWSALHRHDCSQKMFMTYKVMFVLSFTKVVKRWWSVNCPLTSSLSPVHTASEMRNVAGINVSTSTKVCYESPHHFDTNICIWIKPIGICFFPIGPGSVRYGGRLEWSVCCRCMRSLCGRAGWWRVPTQLQGTTSHVEDWTISVQSIASRHAREM